MPTFLRSMRHFVDKGSHNKYIFHWSPLPPSELGIGDDPFPLPMLARLQGGRGESFGNMHRELEKCERALNEYLDMKKNVFPR